MKNYCLSESLAEATIRKRSPCSIDAFISKTV